MSDGVLVFKPVQAWEISFINRDGFINDGGHVLFIEKEDAINFGKKIGSLKYTDSSFEYESEEGQVSVPVVEHYDHFFLITLELDKITNSDLQLVSDEDIPMVWFTKENIHKKCIVDIQKMTI